MNARDVIAMLADDLKKARNKEIPYAQLGVTAQAANAMTRAASAELHYAISKKIMLDIPFFEPAPSTARGK
jgi:hypothetical protein